MKQSFDDAVTQLDNLLEKRFQADTQVRLCSLCWSLRDAPDIGLGIALDGAERMKQGRHMDDDLVRDAVLTVELMWECDQLSHFALESTIRYLHAAGDLLAQVINSALRLRLPERDCSLAKVQTKLCHEPRWSGLAASLSRFKTSSEYEYVTDGCNRTKHRNALKSNISARVEDGGGVDVRQSLAAFEHDARSHDETEAAEISSNVDALKCRVGDVLGELHTALICDDATGPSDG